MKPDVFHDPEPEKFLLCGWRRNIRDTLMILDTVLVRHSQGLGCILMQARVSLLSGCRAESFPSVQPRGSEVHIICQLSIEDRLGQFEHVGADRPPPSPQAFAARC